MSDAGLLTGLRAAAGALTGVALVGALVGLSRVPWEVGSGGGARLRLSWQSSSERVESCRPATEAELAARPPHMRMEEICEARLLPFRLRIRVDGDLLVDEIVAPRGARGDRPLSVLHDLPLEPGSHSLRVVFEPELAHEEDPISQEAERIPEPLTLRARIDLAPSEVALITRDRDGLVLRRRSESEPPSRAP